MKHVTAAILAAAIGLPAIAYAQIKTLPGDAITATASIETIDHTKRTLTLKGPDGRLETLTVPADIKRFDELKVGDKITAKYYENVVLRKKAPGEKDVDTYHAADTRGTGKSPSGTSAAQRTITATITAIDPKIPSITLSGPSNWHYSSKVADKEALKQLKVGDKLDITWTAAVLISADPPKK
jgi:hypothetical protein